MGLFDDLFGGSNKTSTTQKTNTNSATTGQQQQTNQTVTTQDTKQSQTSQSAGETKSTNVQAQQSAGENIVSSLDKETIDLLKNILTPAAAGAVSGAGSSDVNATALKKISDNLYSKATGGNNADVKAAIDASTSKAKLDFETGEGSQIEQVAQQIGSKGNTYSKLLAQKGSNDLATQIAAIAAQGALQADQLNTADFNSAADAIVKASSVAGNDATSKLNPVLQIINLLKGATTQSKTSEITSGQSETGTQTSEKQIADVISAITGKSQGESDTNQSGTLSSVSNTTGNEQTKSSKGIIGDILSIF